MSMIKSRMFGGFDIQGHQRAPCLVPMADMPNHAQRGGSQLRSMPNLDGTISLVLTALEPIAAGSEVVISYHIFDMGGQFAGFGFCTPDAAPFMGPDMISELLRVLEGDEMGATKLRLFQDANCDDASAEEAAMQRGGDVLREALLPCARIMALNNEVVGEIIAEGSEDSTKDEMLKEVLRKIQGPISVEHEAAALRHLIVVHQSFIDRDRMWQARGAILSARSKERSIEALLFARKAELAYHQRSVSRLEDMVSALGIDVDEDQIDDL